MAMVSIGSFIALHSLTEHEYITVVRKPDGAGAATLRTCRLGNVLIAGGVGEVGVVLGRWGRLKVR